MRRCVVVALSAAGVALAVADMLVFADAASAQTISGAAPGSIWQTGTAPTLYTGRESPNLQPSAQSLPAGSANVSAPQASGVGIALAGGTFYAGGTGGTFYDDNVFATNTNRLADWAFFQRPEFAWVKQGSNYTVAADGFVEGREYATYASEDQVNGGTGASFTVTPDSNTQIVGSAHYLHEHLDRGASDTIISLPTGSELLSTLFTHPVAYDEGIESIALNKRYGNWWSSLGGAGLEINYQNAVIGSMFGPNPFAGDTVNFNYADGGIGAVNGRVGYVVAPLTSLFGEVAVNTRDWGVTYFDSNGYRVDAGLLLEQGPGARLKGELWFGFMNQVYNGITMQTVSTWTYNVDLAAIITDDLTAVVQGRREAKEAALALAPFSAGSTELTATATTCSTDMAACVSDIETAAGARLDYRIIPKVVVGGGVSYLEDDYQGAAAFGRVDRTFGPIGSLKYLYSPNITFGFDYRAVEFGSTGGFAPAGSTSVNTLPFYKNVYIFSVSGRY